MTATALTLYYDGKCPFCAVEMQRLRTWDRDGWLAFTDIAVPGFDPAHLNASMEQLNLQLYSQAADGQVLIGIDSMLAAYTLVGRGWMVWPLRVPVLRGALSILYQAFARNRYKLSALLGYKAPACADGVCEIGNPFLKNRNKS
ncbi:MAG: thiol-disulfide oxidoreductase DCC family protein [Massilia sp.]